MSGIVYNKSDNVKFREIHCRMKPFVPRERAIQV